MSEDGFGIGDKVTINHKRKDEKTGKIKNPILPLLPKKIPKKENIPTLVQIPSKSFCLECGGELTPLLILYCQDCDQRYLAQQDELLGKWIIVPLGKEPEEESETESKQ